MSDYSVAYVTYVAFEAIVWFPELWNV